VLVDCTNIFLNVQNKTRWILISNAKVAGIEVAKSVRDSDSSRVSSRRMGRLWEDWVTHRREHKAALGNSRLGSGGYS
jgi:hypothetical protein